MTTSLLLLLTGLGAGGLGSMLGLGGGVIVVPIMTLALGLPMHESIATSLVAIVVNSCGGAVGYLPQGRVRIRLALLLLLSTCVGAVAGGLLAGSVDGSVLSFIFGVVLVYLAYPMGKAALALRFSSVFGRTTITPQPTTVSQPPLPAVYAAQFVPNASRLPLASLGSAVAGVVSGMLGIGGGAIQVPIMHLWLKLGLKEAAATSNYMIGATAAASAFVYYGDGRMNLGFILPVAVGVFVGSRLGVSLAGKFSPRVLSGLFAVLILVLGLQMLLKSVGWWWR